MRRGDVVVVATSGDYGKPRPAVIVQTDALPDDHGSVILCQMTSATAPSDYRVVLEATADNGLRNRSEIMVDKPVTVRRERIGAMIGRLSNDELRRLNMSIAFVMGLGD